MPLDRQNLNYKISDPAIKHLIEDTLVLAKDLDTPEEVVASLEKSVDLSLKRLEFTNDTTTPMSSTCSKIDSETWSHDWPKVYEEGKTTWNCPPMMISSNVACQFIKSIVSATQAKRVLEVGMFTGCTAVAMAEALPADGKVVTIDIDEYFKTFVQNMTKEFRHKDKIDIVIGKAIEVMTKMIEEGKQFDIVFLDAVKFEYPEYLRLCIDGNLLAPNGTIIVDNAYQGTSGYTNPESASAKFAHLIKNDPRLHTVLVPISDGMFLVRRRNEVDERDA